VAIARALLTSPRLLLMDEPLAALDRESKGAILPLLERLQRRLEIPVLYVSHSLDEVARIADHLALMEAGRVGAVGPVGELLTRLDLPLARGDTAEALVEAVVAGHEEEHGLTRLEFPGGRFLVARRDLEPGTRVALRILARDVSLTLERQTGTSILNIFPVVVTELADGDLGAAAGAAEVIVRLEAGGVPLLARVTRRSAAALDLRPGARLFAQVKSVALLD
jgi:molybdate transport system ATP-binding protein